jgi:hypothetical protein
VLQTLAEIGSTGRIPEILRRAKDNNDPFRLMASGTASTRATTRG